MKIISHRGFWLTPKEKNTLSAFVRTTAAGYGTETDVRDRDGQLVVAHDPATPADMSWAAMVALFAGTDLPLAVNVKADGLAPLLAATFANVAVDWFAFDMSGPEMVRYRKAGLPFYTRHSDLEPDPLMYEAAQGVWLDAFDDSWYDAATIDAHVRQGKKVCIVSNELHGRDPTQQWRMLQAVRNEPNVTLCTDRPTDAAEILTS